MYISPVQVFDSKWYNSIQKFNIMHKHNARIKHYFRPKIGASNPCGLESTLNTFPNNMLSVTNNISVYLVALESINAHFNEYSVSQYMYNRVVMTASCNVQLLLQWVGSANYILTLINYINHPMYNHLIWTACNPTICR